MLIELTENELKIIAAGLQELPFKLSSPVIRNIQAQYDEMNTPKGTNTETTQKPTKRAR